MDEGYVFPGLYCCAVELRCWKMDIQCFLLSFMSVADTLVTVVANSVPLLYTTVSLTYVIKSTTFDVSVWELFWWSFHGAALHLLAPDEEKDPQAVVRAIENQKVSTLSIRNKMLRKKYSKGSNFQILKKDY